MKKVDWIALFGFIVISQAAGVAGSMCWMARICDTYSPSTGTRLNSASPAISIASAGISTARAPCFSAR